MVDGSVNLFMIFKFFAYLEVKEITTFIYYSNIAIGMITFLK